MHARRYPGIFAFLALAFPLNASQLTITEGPTLRSPSPLPLVGDFDGDGHSDIAIWDPIRARALLDATSDGRIDGITPPLGLSTDVPFMGDWDGDGIETLALYRSSTNQVIHGNSNQTGSYRVRSVKAVGARGGIPLRGDWDGDGKDGFAIYDMASSTFRIYQSMGATKFTSRRFGKPGDLPVSGDWNNDGKDGYAVYRPSERRFYVTDALGSRASMTTIEEGDPGDVPLAGKWHGHTNWSIGLFRPSTLQFFLFDDLNLSALQRVTWADTTSVITTNGRQLFYTDGTPHTDASGAPRSAYSPTRSFLPLGIFNIDTDTTETGGNVFQQLQDAGFNLAMLWPSFLELDSAVAKAGPTGVMLVPRITLFRSSYDANSRVFAWYVWDEPHAADLDSLRSRYAEYHPRAAHPLAHTNLFPSTTGPSCNVGKNDDPTWATLAAMGDASYLDCYPVHRPVDPNLTFESIANAVTTLRTVPRSSRPLWFVSQAYGDTATTSEMWNMPTPAQYRAAVYTALVHGATGFIAFARDGLVTRNAGALGISPTPATTYPKCAGCLAATDSMKRDSRALWNSVIGLNRELSQLKPALLSPTDSTSYTVALLGPAASGDSPIRTLLKHSPDGSRYLLAVNLTSQLLDPVIQFPTKVTSAAVPFEHRTIATPLSAIRDRFGPYTVHIYKF